jgi:hypothetical protein
VLSPSLLKRPRGTSARERAGQSICGPSPQACKKPRERLPRALFLSLSLPTPDSRSAPCCRRVATPLAALVAQGKASTRRAPLTDHRRSKTSEPQNLGSPHRHRQSAMGAPLRRLQLRSPTSRSPGRELPNPQCPPLITITSCYACLDPIICCSGQRQRRIRCFFLGFKFVRFGMLVLIGAISPYLVVLRQKFSHRGVVGRNLASSCLF